MNRILLALFALLLIAGVAQSKPLRHGGGTVTSVLTCTITTSSPLPAVTVGTPYSATLHSANCPSPVWSLSVAISPNTGAWLTLNSSTGVLSGTPGTPETETFTARVTGTGPVSATQPFSLTVNPSGGGSETPLFNYANFTSPCASGAMIPRWHASCSGGVVFPNQPNHTSGGIWNELGQINTASGFNTFFTFQFTNLPSIANCFGYTGSCISTLAFVIQDSQVADYAAGAPGATPGNTPLTGCFIYGSTICQDNAGEQDANLGGFGMYGPTSSYNNQWPIFHSVAIKFDVGCSNSAAGGTYFAGNATSVQCTGLYVNGGTWNALSPMVDMTQSGINFFSSDIMQGHVTYDGSTLTMTVLDTTTHASFRTSWPINIPATINGNAWVGFTGGCGPACALTTKVLSWSLNSGINNRLATPTISPASGPYTSAQAVTLSGPGGAAIYYTTNGNVPTPNSTLYTGPFTVSTNTVVQAMATQANFTDSFTAAANYLIQAGSTPNRVNQPSGFNSNIMQVNCAGSFTGSAIQLSDNLKATNAYSAGSAFYPIPLSFAAGFHSVATIQFTTSGGGGMAFVIQNQDTWASQSINSWLTGGPNACANRSNGFGFSGYTQGGSGMLTGFKNVAAIKFDIGSTANSVGLYEGLQDPTTNSVAVTGLTFLNGNPITVAVTYSGTTLTLTLTDTVTAGTFTHTWTGVNIATDVGASSAYFGFTGSTDYTGTPHKVLNWTLTSP